MRIDLYLRKSSADGGKSVGQQDDDLTEGVQAEGHETGRRFTDDNRSASSFATKRRESYEALVAHIKSGACEAVGIWDVNRGGRHESTYFAFLDLCKAQGVKLWVQSHERLLDLNRDSDWDAIGQEVLESARYSRKLSAASARGKRGAAKAGKPDGGPTLYGYRKTRDDKGKVVSVEVVEEQAAIVRCMAAGALAGTSNAWLARWLNAFEVPSPAGKEWTARIVNRLLANPGYAGHRVHRPRKGEVKLHEGVWPAIIDPKDFRLLTARAEAQRKDPARGREPRWLLVGHAGCGRDGCAGKVRAVKVDGRERYSCRVCHGVSVPAADTDKFVTEVVLAYLGDERSAHLFAPRSDDAAATEAARKAAELTDRLKAFRVQAIAGTVSAESFAEIEAALLPQIKAADKRAAELSAPASLAHLVGVDIPARWGNLGVAAQREIVRHLMKVTVVPADYRGQRWSPKRLLIEPA
jgi:site-specific DNA recombinase